jgi:prephenate dehydrogenase
MRIGIIGNGQFGQLLTRIIREKAPMIVVSLYSRATDSRDILEKIIKTSDVIIPAVPINQFETVVRQIVPMLSEGKTIVDVCSVKEYPVRIMKKYIPAEVNIIATHPLFGPKSWTGVGGTVVVNNVHGDETVFLSIKELFHSLGLSLIEMSPKEHDELQAQSQFFVQTVRSLAHSLHFEKTVIDTPSASLVFEGLETMGNSHELYLDMIRYNPSCQVVLKKMKEELDLLLSNST